MPPPDRIDDPRVVKVGSLVITPSSVSDAIWKKLMLARKMAVEKAYMVKLSILQVVNAQSGLLEFEGRVNKKVIGRFPLTPDATTEA